MTTEMTKKTVCLNMIVKNESAVIERCLRSIKDKIDYWVIVDTGSSDDTQKIIKKCLKGKPGELIERPWVNFGHNRNEALELAKDKADYLLFLDADEELKTNDTNAFEELSMPYYFALHQDGNSQSEHNKPLLVQSNLDWKWQGVVQEKLQCSSVNMDQAFAISSCELISNNDGFRSKDNQKYLKDAEMLLKALQKDPNQAHYQFLLAYSYLKASEKLLALKAFEKRIVMQGDSDELWYSLFSLARLHDELDYKSDIVTRELCIVYQQRPLRQEPLALLAHHHLRQGNLAVAYSLAFQALQIPMPKDPMFVEEEFYAYKTLAIYADTALLLGLKQQALELYKLLQTRSSLPQEMQANIQRVIEQLSV